MEAKLLLPKCVSDVIVFERGIYPRDNKLIEIFGDLNRVFRHSLARPLVTDSDNVLEMRDFSGVTDMIVGLCECTKKYQNYSLLFEDLITFLLNDLAKVVSGDQLQLVRLNLYSKPKKRFINDAQYCMTCGYHSATVEYCINCIGSITTCKIIYELKYRIQCFACGIRQDDHKCKRVEHTLYLSDRDIDVVSSIITEIRFGKKIGFQSMISKYQCKGELGSVNFFISSGHVKFVWTKLDELTSKELKRNLIYHNTYFMNPSKDVFVIFRIGDEQRAAFIKDLLIDI